MNAVAPPLIYLMSISSLGFYVEIKIVSFKLPKKNKLKIVLQYFFMIFTDITEDESEYLEVFI
jgi:hypothetical protein